MTFAQLHDYFTHRELGIQGAVGEYAVLVPLVQREGQLCLLFETRAETLVATSPGRSASPAAGGSQGRPPGKPPCGRPGRSWPSPPRRSSCWAPWT